MQAFLYRIESLENIKIAGWAAAVLAEQLR